MFDRHKQHDFAASGTQRLEHTDLACALGGLGADHTSKDGDAHEDDKQA